MIMLLCPDCLSHNIVDMDLEPVDNSIFGQDDCFECLDCGCTFMIDNCKWEEFEIVDDNN